MNKKTKPTEYMERNIIIYIAICLFTFSCAKKELLTPEETKWLNENKDLKVSVYGNFPPYQFQNENGNIEGLFIDYLQLIESKIDYQFTRVNYNSWSNVINDAKKNKIDLILDIQKTKEKKAYLNFYADLFDTQQNIVVRKEDINTISFKNIKNKKVVLPKDYSITELLKNRFPNTDIFFEKDEDACLKALNDGKYDAYIGPKANSNYFIQKKGYSNLVVGDITPYNYKPTIAVIKSDTILSNIIRKAVANITIEERDVIFNNWLQKKSWPIYRKPHFWLWVLLVLGALIGIIILHNWHLKKLVLQRTKALQIALKEAEKSNKVKNNFIQNISHEIRTPINGILGYSELLRKKETPKEEQKNYINTIIDSSINLVHIIDNIIEISSLHTDQNKIYNKATAIHQAISNIVLQYKDHATKKHLNLVFDQVESLPKVIMIDTARLTKIIKNILDNAIKFTSKGSVEVKYTVNSNLLEIEVIDTGIGIKDEEKEYIFASFSQSENEISKKREGLGLGLTIARHNVLALGGKISLVSKENIGSTFKIQIPITPIDSSNHLTEQLIENKGNNNYQILVAEDEKINFLLVKSVLKRFKPYNFMVIRAENGKEAVTICEENKNIDLILMDIRMPVMDGYEASRHIKKLKPELPIIAHTAYSSDKDIQNAYQAGCDHVIAKPIIINEFKQVIKNYIDQL